jgi:menin
LYLQAVAAARRDYGDQHVYPYTYLAGWHFRQRDYRAALRSWADAANVIKRYLAHWDLKAVKVINSRGLTA